MHVVVALSRLASHRAARLSVAGFCLGVLLVAGAGVVVAADVGEYRRMVAEEVAALERGDEATAVAGRLRAMAGVSLADGGTAKPGAGAVVAALERDPPDRVFATGRLRAILAEIDASPFPHLDGTDARARLNRVLQRPDVQPAPPDPIMEFLNAVWRRVGEWLLDRLDDLFAVGPVRDTVGFLGDILRLIFQILVPIWAYLGILFLLGLAAWVVRGLRRSMAPSAVTMPVGYAGRGESSAQARAEAARLAAAGDFREAMRALYLAVLLHWDEQGRLRFDRALTNREVLALATRRAERDVAARLAPLVDRFDRVWYGGARCTAVEYADFEWLAGQVWATP